MAITIGTNILALQLAKRIGEQTDLVSTSVQRLSSGLRINTPADDPAGLILATGLKNQSRLAIVATRNANDAISLLSISDSALGAIHNILTRMAELASQSANGVFSTFQRSPLQAEFLALASEIERIALTTRFNGINLLSSSRSITFQVGFDSYSTSQLQVNTANGLLQGMNLASPGSSALNYQINGTTIPDAQANAITALAAVEAAMDQVSTQRGMLGASESRLSHAIDNLSVAAENFAAAADRITDVDVAQETANLVKHQILQNAAVALLSHSNVTPQLALQLLDLRK